jgi:hypothetical protein
MTTPTPTTPKTNYWLDLAERWGATAAEAAIAVLITDLTGIDTWWAVPVASGLALVKGWLAKFVAKKGTASLVQ